MLKIASSTSLSPAQQWVLSVGALLNAKEGHVLNELATGIDNATLQGGLNNAWGIHNREEFLARAQTLSAYPNKMEFEAVWAEMRKFLEKEPAKTGFFAKIVGAYTGMLGVTNPIKLNAAMTALKGKTSDTDAELAEKLNNSANWLEMLETVNITPNNVNNMMIWDASRLTNVARWALQIGWISEAEFFSICTPLAVQAQRAYSSWKEMLDACLVASIIWQYEESRFEGFCEATKALQKDPTSPTAALAWNTALN